MTYSLMQLFAERAQLPSIPNRGVILIGRG
jgi:hypothetical protein